MPASDPLIPALNFGFVCQVEAQYTALLKAAGADLQDDPGLGGKLLYAGDLLPGGRALLVAGNIAGAASLAACADAGTQRQAIREGVADFLVTSLDEALRILKNEIRKKETVAVCVASAPEAIEQEMRERGVAPDLPGSTFEKGDEPTERVLVSWSVAAAPAQWLPKLDALALDCFGGSDHPDAGALRRWLHFSPRYLGRLAHGFRVVRSTREAAEGFAARVQRAVACAEIGIEVRVSLNRDEEVLSYAPAAMRSSQAEG